MTTKPRGRTRAGTAADRSGRRAAPPVPRWGLADEPDPAEFTEPAELVDPNAAYDRHALDVLDLSDRIELPRAESIAEIGEDQLVAEHEAIRRLGVAIFDGPMHLAQAEQAVAASGHLVIHAATGRGGLETLAEVIANEAAGVDAVLVGLPGGELLIDTARALDRPPVVIAACAGLASDAIDRALAAGADLVALRPYDGERLAPILLAAARLVDARAQPVRTPGLRDRLEELRATEPSHLIPFQQFQRELETELRRARRYSYPIAVALLAVDIPPAAAAPAIKAALKGRAGATLVQAMRDIDLATELEGDRFLVLMPYTELTGAGEVARRIIAAVAAQDPVVVGGRSYRVRVVGAIASARSEGQPLSFARLMKDATRALEQARRDGADFAVIP